MKPRNKLFTILLISCFATTPKAHPFVDTLKNLSTQDLVAIVATLVTNGILLSRVAIQEKTLKEAWEDKDWELITLMAANSIFLGYGIGRFASVNWTTSTVPTKTKSVPTTKPKKAFVNYYKLDFTTGRKKKKKRKKKRKNLKDWLIGLIKESRNHTDEDLEKIFN
jgi:hypothetical protein